MNIHSLSTACAKILPHVQSAVLLFVRVTMGWGFFLSGKGKLMNLERTTGFFESLHSPAPRWHAVRHFVGQRPVSDRRVGDPGCAR